jgi:hypothetical protein
MLAMREPEAEGGCRCWKRQRQNLLLLMMMLLLLLLLLMMMMMIRVMLGSMLEPAEGPHCWWCKNLMPQDWVRLLVQNMWYWRTLGVMKGFAEQVAVATVGHGGKACIRLTPPSVLVCATLPPTEYG